jgi:hypothetical protein
MHRQNLQRTGRRTQAAAPSILTQPSSRAVAVGGSVTLTVNAEGDDTLSFQWYLNGAPIAGATGSTLTLSNMNESQAGSYTVVVTNGRGSTTSSAANITVATASNLSRIINLSARARAGTDNKTFIVGLAITGSGTQPLLVRGIGPTLTTLFSVPGTLTDPKLTLFSGSNAIKSNDNWGGDANLVTISQQVGAFNIPAPTTKDAVLAADLTPGNYTAQVTAASGDTSGVALAEFYDATQVYTAGSPRLFNISARADVGTDANVLIVGFVISGATPKTVLIRAIGPTLTNLNVTGVLADPKLTLRTGSGTLVLENDNWASASNFADLQAAMGSAGAFPLATSSKDAAMLVTLNPGDYTAVVAGVGNTTGVALAEVYEVP